MELNEVTFDYDCELCAFINIRKLKKEDIQQILVDRNGKFVLFYWM